MWLGWCPDPYWAAWSARGFVGAQADILFLKVYGQLNVTLDKSVGGHVGVRFVL